VFNNTIITPDITSHLASSCGWLASYLAAWHAVGCNNTAGSRSVGSIRQPMHHVNDAATVQHTMEEGGLEQILKRLVLKKT
jgi:hypothetical protein